MLRFQPFTFVGWVDKFDGKVAAFLKYEKAMLLTQDCRSQLQKFYKRIKIGHAICKANLGLHYTLIFVVLGITSFHYAAKGLA